MRYLGSWQFRRFSVNFFPNNFESVCNRPSSSTSNNFEKLTKFSKKRNTNLKNGHFSTYENDFNIKNFNQYSGKRLIFGVDSKFENSLLHFRKQIDDFGRLHVLDFISKIVSPIKNGRALNFLRNSPSSLEFVISCCGKSMTSINPIERTHILIENIWEPIENAGYNFSLEMFNAMLIVFIENGHIFEPKELLKSMEKLGILPNSDTYSLLITKYSLDGNIDEVYKLRRIMSTKNMIEDDSLRNAEIYCLFLTDHRSDATDLLNSLSEDKLSSGFGAILRAAAKKNDPECVFLLLNTAKMRHVDIDDDSLLELVWIFAEMGQNLENVEKLLLYARREPGYFSRCVNLLDQLAVHGYFDKTIPVLKSIDSFPFIESIYRILNNMVGRQSSVEVLLGMLSDMKPLMKTYEKSELLSHMIGKCIVSKYEYKDLQKLMQELIRILDPDHNRVHLLFPLMITAKNASPNSQTLLKYIQFFLESGYGFDIDIKKLKTSDFFYISPLRHLCDHFGFIFVVEFLEKFLPKVDIDSILTILYQKSRFQNNISELMEILALRGIEISKLIDFRSESDKSKKKDIENLNRSEIRNRLFTYLGENDYNKLRLLLKNCIENSDIQFNPNVIIQILKAIIENEGLEIALEIGPKLPCYFAETRKASSGCLMEIFETVLNDGQEYDKGLEMAEQLRKMLMKMNIVTSRFPITFDSDVQFALSRKGYQVAYKVLSTQVDRYLAMGGFLPLLRHVLTFKASRNEPKLEFLVTKYRNIDVYFSWKLAILIELGQIEKAHRFLKTNSISYSELGAIFRYYLFDTQSKYQVYLNLMDILLEKTDIVPKMGANGILGFIVHPFIDHCEKSANFDDILKILAILKANGMNDYSLTQRCYLFFQKNDRIFSPEIIEERCQIV